MLRLIRQIGLTVLIALAMSTGYATTASAQQPSAAEKSYTSAAKSRAQLVDRLDKLETEYKGIVRRIEARKRSGALDTFAGKLELQNLLAEAKSLSDRLGALQDDVREIDRRMETQREHVLTDIDGQVATLERALRRAPSSARAGIVQELNALRQRRARYSAPLPEAPSLSEINDAMSLAEEVDPSQPEELEAAADELEDTEDQIRRRLDAVRSRLDELNRKKRLQRRDAQFRKEAGFYEEQVRSNRNIVRVNRANSGNGGGDNSAEEPANDSAGDGFQGSPTEPTTGNNSAGDRVTDDGMGMDLAAGESAAPPENDSPGFTDSPDSADQAPPSSNDDPFGGSGTGSVVIAAGADPTLAVSDEPRNVREVNAAIQELEEEEGKLSKQASELERKASSLRKKAQDLQ